MTVMLVFFSFDAGAIFVVLVDATAQGSPALIFDDSHAAFVLLILVKSYLQPYIIVVKTITQTVFYSILQRDHLLMQPDSIAAYLA